VDASEVSVNAEDMGLSSTEVNSGSRRLPARPDEKTRAMGLGYETTWLSCWWFGALDHVEGSHSPAILEEVLGAEAWQIALDHQKREVHLEEIPRPFRL